MKNYTQEELNKIEEEGYHAYWDGVEDNPYDVYFHPKEEINQDAVGAWDRGFLEAQKEIILAPGAEDTL